MKSKMLVVLSTLTLALALTGQSATQITPPAAPEKAKSCACCNHDKSGATSDGKVACCGKAGDCCKDGKCQMKSGDDKQTMLHDEMMSKDRKGGMKCAMMSSDKSCCGKDGDCCKDGKCDMANNKGKSCCDDNKCARSQAGV